MGTFFLASLLVFLPICLGSNQTVTDIAELSKIPPGFKRFGDVILPEDFFNSSFPKAAVPDRSRIWPNARVPFVIHNSLSNAARNIYQAMEEYHGKTCVRFVPRTNERNYVGIFDGPGCYSLIGLANQGMQPLSLGMGCTDHGTIVHELGHAIGFFHEHQRSDRDDYIQILWDNIDPAMYGQFEKLEPWQNWLINDFDINSIMMYGATAFSKENYSPTMVHLGGRNLIEVYQKPGLDYSDVQRVNRLYGC